MRTLLHLSAITFAFAGCTQEPDNAVPANDVGVTALEIDQTFDQLKIVGYSEAHEPIAELSMTNEDGARVLKIEVDGVTATRHIEGDDLQSDLDLPTLATTDYAKVNAYVLALMAYEPARTALAARHMAFHQRELQVAPDSELGGGEAQYWACTAQYSTNLKPMTYCCESPGRSYWWPTNSHEQLNCGISPNTGHLVYADRICQPTPYANTYCGQTGSRGCKPCWDPVAVTSCWWSGSGTTCYGSINGSHYEPPPYTYEIP